MSEISADISGRAPGAGDPGAYVERDELNRFVIMSRAEAERLRWIERRALQTEATTLVMRAALERIFKANETCHHAALMIGHLVPGTCTVDYAGLVAVIDEAEASHLHEVGASIVHALRLARAALVQDRTTCHEALMTLGTYGMRWDAWQLCQRSIAMIDQALAALDALGIPPTEAQVQKGA